MKIHINQPQHSNTSAIQNKYQYIAQALRRRQAAANQKRVVNTQHNTQHDDDMLIELQQQNKQQSGSKANILTGIIYTKCE